MFSNPDLTWDELDAAIQLAVAEDRLGWNKGYGLSKAGLSALTLIQARELAPLTVTSLSPGFIDTAMTAGLGARLSPEQGCVSSLKCLFGDVTSGFYYGSDGLRSPLVSSTATAGKGIDRCVSTNSTTSHSPDDDPGPGNPRVPGRARSAARHLQPLRLKRTPQL